MSEVRCRRKRTLVWLALAGACVLASWGIVQAGGKPKPPPPPPPPPGPAYTLQVLEGIGVGIDRFAPELYVNDGGQVAGTRGGHAAVWQTATAAPTDLDNGFNDSAVLAINSSGQVVGYCADAVYPYGWEHPVVWIPDGQGGYGMTDLAPGYQENCRAYDINKDGLVVGEAGLSEVGFVVVPKPDAAGRPSWFADDNSDGVNDRLYEVAVDDASSDTRPFGINDAGWVVGSCHFGAFFIIPDYSQPNPWWKDANGDGVNDLATKLPGAGEAKGLNNEGQIIGSHFLWRVEVAADGMVTVSEPMTLPPPPIRGDYMTFPVSINDAGQVAGYAREVQNINKPTAADRKAILWQSETGTLLLNDLVSSMAGFTDLDAAGGINNLGQIAGGGTTRSGSQGFLATPAGN
jgi:uncharacterized membrane protein